MIEDDYKIMVKGTQKGGKLNKGRTQKMKTIGPDGNKGIQLKSESEGKMFAGNKLVGQGGKRSRVQDEGGAGGGLQLGFVAGVILRERLPAFEKMLWRACRGNVFLRVAEIEDPLEDPHTGDEVIKSVFVIFFQGQVFTLKAVLRIRIRWIYKILASWIRIRIRENIRIRIQG